jgi:hypothetical protein
MSDVEARIKRLEAFRQNLIEWHKSEDQTLLEWLKQNKNSVEREVMDAGRYRTVAVPSFMPKFPFNSKDSKDSKDPKFETYSINPFQYLLTPLFGKSSEAPLFAEHVVPHVTRMLDQTITVLNQPKRDSSVDVKIATRKGYAFVAMPMDENNHALVDVLEAIKAGAKECGITAERIDDDESSERITDRMLDSLRAAEFVIVDLTEGRPNVFYEAGYAHGIGKIPIYVARQGTDIHFDLKDYPVIFFRSMKELREKLARRFKSIAKQKQG